MDQVTFRDDTVLSDVHLLLPNAHHLMSHLNAVGQPVFVSRFKILRDCADGGGAGGGVSLTDAGGKTGGGRRVEGEEARGRRGERGSGTGAFLDEDGDLDVMRRPRDPASGEQGTPRRDAICPIILTQGGGAPTEEEQEELSRDVIVIEHTMATPLDDVGKQGATVLELGAGTGITSITAATLAKTVYCTDVGQDLLRMCQRNVTLNRHILDPAGEKVRVRELDWLGDEFSTEAEAEFSWTEEEVADLHDNATVVMAGDVCYDDELTNGFFRTIYRLTSHFRNPSTIYLSIEKRLNFTLRHMDVSCEAYEHFRRCLRDLQDMADNKTSFTVERVAPEFPQFFYYERVEQLELWKVVASPL